MSIGNVFTLLVNNTKDDEIMYATEGLIKILQAFERTKLEDCLNHYKKYFADFNNSKTDVSFTRQKNVFINNQITFCKNKLKNMKSVYEVFEKTHNVFINTKFKPCLPLAYTYLKASDREGKASFGNELNFKIPKMGIWISDMVLHVTLKGLSVKNPIDRVKYADRLGHRLIERARFKINETTLTDYTSEDYNLYFESRVPVHKKQGWTRNIGQEVPSFAYLTPDPSTNNFREYRLYASGPQTQKESHDTVDLWIPLIFWFNTDLRHAFPNILLPYGSLKIGVKFADISKLVTAIDYGGGGEYNAPYIETADLYVNHINAIPEIANQIASKNHFSLIRVSQHFDMTLNEPHAEINLKNITFPMESMSVAFRPLENLDNIENWYRNSKLTPVNVRNTVVIGPDNSPTIAVNNAIYYTETDVVDKVSLKLKEVELYPHNPINLYTSYIPYVMPGINTPDSQTLFFNFALRNDLDEVSGHLNMSKNRELYLKYESSVINNNNRAKIYVITRSINFLIIDSSGVMFKYF